MGQHRMSIVVAAVVAAASGCVMDTEQEIGRSAYAIAEQMAADGIDPGPIIEDGPEAVCDCGTGFSTACEYVYYPAAEVCFYWDDYFADLYASYGAMYNESATVHQWVECSMGTVFPNSDFHNPSHLTDVAVYSRKPSGASDNILITMAAATMTTDSWDPQDTCDNSTGSTNPVQTLCETEPLDADQYLIAFDIYLPDYYEGGGAYYINGFRLCYEPD